MENVWKLLLIDDCTEDREVYRRYLSQDPHQDYRFIEADSAEKGLMLCQEGVCDIVLLDFNLPDLTGLEFLHHLEQQQAEFEVPVIMLTGYGDEALALKAMQQGVKDYLIKQHLKPDVLQLAVRNVIEKSCLQTQLSKTQDLQRLIATTALRIRKSLDLEQILKTTASEVQQLLKCNRVIVCQFTPEMTGAIVAESVEAGWKSALGLHIQDVDFQNWKQVIHGNERKRSISDINQTDLNDYYLNLLKQFEVKASLVVPITFTSSTAGKSVSKPWGLLIAHQCSEKRQWQKDEVNLFEQLSVQLAIAIQQAELFSRTQAALTKEKELNTFKSQIVATVSHEYRTPLAAIWAAASTLKKHQDQLSHSQKQRLLEIIEQKSKHMETLVEDMLIVNQFELNSTTFKPFPIDVFQFFSELMEEQREIADERYTLQYRSWGDCQGFWGDRGLLRQIFSNLISNAIKYSPNGGNIELQLIGHPSHITLSLKDEGIGIPNEDQMNLFQAFSRGSNVDTIPGTGLGLTIIQACVKLHGGNVFLASLLGEGCQVTINLPKEHLSTRSENEFGKDARKI